MAGKKGVSGAKPKLTENMIEKAGKLITAGNYAIVVCQYLGINQTTFYSYLKKGEADIADEKETLYSKFYNTIKEAETVAEMRNVQIIQQAATGTWQAAAWYLERKHRDRWSAKQIQEITGKDGGAIEIGSAREQIESKLALLRKRERNQSDSGRDERNPDEGTDL